MQKYIISTILFLSIILTVKSQTVVLEEDVNADTLDAKFGKNRMHYRHPFIEIGFVTPFQENTEQIIFFKTYNYKIGLKYKLKLCEYYSIGYDIYLSHQTYNLVQDSIPNNTKYYKEKLITNSLGLELYNRFNFRKRGDFIGKYIDIGVFGHFVFDRKTKTIYKMESTIPETMSNKVKSVSYNLIYVRNYQYGLNARLGFNRYVLSASYRLSDFFVKEADGFTFNFTELPRFSLGLQIGIF